jgi:ATP-binding cassette subfamily B protein/subfamily B ATP-binding cassette protein MsbA
MSRPSANHVYLRSLPYYREYWGKTLLAVLLTLLLVPFSLLRPWPLAFILFRVLRPGWDGQLGPFDMGGLHFPQVDLSEMESSHLVLGACVAAVVVHVLAGLASYGAIMLFLRVGYQAQWKLRTELYEAMHTLPLAYHDRTRSADSSYRVAYDAQCIQTIYAKWTFLFQTVVTLSSTFWMMWSLDRDLSLLALVVVPLMLVSFRMFARMIRRQAVEISERESEVLMAATEGLASVRMVQAFGREPDEVAHLSGYAAGSREANMRMQHSSLLSNLLISTFLAISTVAIYYVGSHHVGKGLLSLESLFAIATYIITLYQPLDMLTQVGWDMEKAAASVQRCFEVIDHDNEVPEPANPRVLGECRGELEFRDITFGYRADRPILSGVNVRVPAGKTVAFVGGTGSGKSTLLSLVPRFYDPVRGEIVLDGVPIRELSKRELRQHIGIVLQDTLLFSTTVRANIAYGRPDATDEQIVAAAKRAQAHEFIMGMPQGYDTPVGERGGHLSVGQRQRIGIARAFLKDAPILLLDEPTSALDPSTESAIMATMEELMRGRTTLIITHRIATIHRVDWIVVIGPGGVMEEGTGPDLLARGGVYARLHSAANAAG